VTQGDTNPRFVVTSLSRTEAEAQRLYEKIYCARGEMENRIKECQADLFADRTSTATMRANQLCLWFASMAYVLLCTLRHIDLRFTQFANATCGTIRLRLLKIGALVTTSVRRIKIAMASAYPWRDEWGLAHAFLCASRRSPTNPIAHSPADQNRANHHRRMMPHAPTSLKYHSCEHCEGQRVQTIAIGPFTPRS
jgi:hypothetical protein